MSQLTNTLKSYLAQAPDLGTRTVPRNRRDDLTRRLAGVSRSNTTFFAASFAATVLLFVASTAAIHRWFDDPAQIGRFFAGVGVSVTGLIVYMTRLWKQKVAADTLLALVPEVDNEQLTKIIERLLRQF